MSIDRRTRILTRAYELIVLVLAFFFLISAQAAESISMQEDRRIQDYIRKSKPSWGLVAGSVDVPGDHAEGALGADFSFELIPPISLGLNYTYAGMGEPNRRGLLMGKIAYNLTSNVPIVRYSYLGLNAGWVHDTTEVAPGVLATDDSFALGPIAGFDQPLSRHWTIGAEAKYLLTLADGVEDSFIFLGAVKYWY